MVESILILVLLLIALQCYRIWSLHQRAKELRKILERLGVVEDNQCDPRS